jgi:deoxyribodipyrimidine photo-lyase
MQNALIWFRQDLRLTDNQAFFEACKNSNNITAIYIHDETPPIRPLGGASKWWLHHSLASLQNDLAEYGINLVIKTGNSLEVLQGLFDQKTFNTIYWNRLYEPYYTARDAKIKDSLKAQNINVQSFNGSLLTEPWVVKNGSGEYFKVFTPYYKSCLANHQPPEPLAKPEVKKYQTKNIAGISLQSLDFLPTKPNWATGFNTYFTVGEAGAKQRFLDFLDNKIEHYGEKRDYAGEDFTSKISPHLHFGEISPNLIYYACRQEQELNGHKSKGVEKFVAEIYWREFSYNLLYNYPNLPEQNFRADFNNFPWLEDAEALKKWQKGQTGYPIVDAGLRELWHTGWMHNRVRMIVGSFLTKDLVQHWKHGENWFWDCLVDADAASNAASWQWVAGSGADAAPYFRIFNPITQGEKFDANGDYVRKWCPELKHLPNEFIHCPWKAPELVLRAANVQLGKNYPKPIVDHAKSRDIALNAFASIKK